MKICYFLSLVLLLSVPITAPGQSSGQSPAPQDEVNDRINRLEAETQTLREQVKRLQDQPARLPAIEAAPAGMALAPDAVGPAPAPPDTAVVPEGATAKAGEGNYFSMDQLRGEMKKYSWGKGDFSVTPYGYLWGNTVYSTERTTPGSYTLYVQSASTTPESECIVDVRNTRLGFDVLGPKLPCLGGAETGGKVEVDFQNSVLTTENKPTIMLRHAYAEAKNDEYRILVGQTWDVISPLNPDMLLYSVGWDAGNIGYRRAQFRYERYLALSDVSLLTVQSSIDQDVFPDSSTTATGEPSNWPIVEGRVAWTAGHRGQGCLPITVGLSGHIGEDEFDSTVLGRDNRKRTWSGNIDVRVPWTERLGFEGECFIGENLSPFLGGIGQGIDPTTGTPIRDGGGWFEVWYDFTTKLHTHVGYSVDEPDKHDLTNAADRSFNQFYFGNLIYDVTKNLLVGVEVSQWETLYVGELPGESLRTEFVVKYGF